MKPSDRENIIAKWATNQLNEEELREMEQMEDLTDLKLVIDDIETWKVKPANTAENLEKLLLLTKSVKKETNKKTKIISMNRILAVAASVAILIGSYFGVKNFDPDSIIINTQIGEQKTINLPGGSIIMLDALSKIEYIEEEWADKRLIHLDGQAFFDVTKGRKFMVESPAGNVEVLGTDFNVKSVGLDMLEVRCYSGKVSVTSKESNVILEKGEGVEILNGAIINIILAKDKPAWRRGLSNFKKTELNDVVIELKKYYNVDIELPANYKTLKFTGAFIHTDLTSAMEMIFVPMAIEFEIKDNKVIFL